MNFKKNNASIRLRLLFNIETNMGVAFLVIIIEDQIVDNIKEIFI